MSFFARTDTGSIVNRFSQDLELVDMLLPVYAVNFIIGKTTFLDTGVELTCELGRCIYVFDKADHCLRHRQISGREYAVPCCCSIYHSILLSTYLSPDAAFGH
jgi:hypothetical protein